jgi:serine-type D-Ala-D-Ala carboxypeptidase (penicillin-binding protein 5/6)
MVRGLSKGRVLTALRRLGLCVAIASLPWSAAQAFESEAAQAVLYDVGTDSVLYAKDSETTFPPASLAKLMTLGVAFEELGSGRLSPQQTFKITEHAWRTGGGPARTTSMFAKLNSEVAVSDLIRGVAVVVGNDASIALAEGIAGSEPEFAVRMNQLGQEIGLTSSRFVNATGLPAPGAQTNARDLARIAAFLATKHPERYGVFSEADLDWNRIRQSNRNPLLNSYDGVDGLLIGSVAERGHMIAVSALRGQARLVAVLAGLPDEGARVRAAKALLDYGFEGHIERQLFEANAPVAEAQVFGGTRTRVRLVAGQAIHMLVPKDGDSRLVARAVYRGPISAPVTKGDRVGSLRIFRDGLLQREVPLVADESVPEGTLLRKALDATYELGANAVGALISRIM